MTSLSASLPILLGALASYKCKHEFMYHVENNTSNLSEFKLINSKGTAIPIQACTCPEGSRSLRLPDFKMISTWKWYGCHPYTPASFTPQDIYLVFISVRGWVEPKGHSATGMIMSEGNFIDTIGSRARDLPACSTVPQPNALPRVPN